MSDESASRRLVRLERDGAAALIVLDRPEVLNAVSDELRDHLIEALEYCAADESVRYLVLTGAGRAFCAGGDISGMEDRLALPSGRSAALGWRRMRRVHRAVHLLHGLEKVTIAAVNGPAAGLGCDLALSCDFVVASSLATFSMSYIRRGLTPDGGGLYFLPRRVGLSRAKELIFSGRFVESGEALEIGLADAVVAPEALLSEARRLGERFADAPALALALAKSVLDRSFELGLDEVLALGAEAQAMCYTTDEHRQAVEEFLASRRRR